MTRTKKDADFYAAQLDDYIRRLDSTCAFTGHRPSKLPWRLDYSASGYIAFHSALEKQIEEFSAAGIKNYFCGMAIGTDLICAQIVLALRERNPAIKLHCAIPCKSQADKWEASLRDQYHAVLAEADSVIFVNREWTKNCMLERNRFMVDRCSIVLAVYNGEYRGGTAATVRYARKMGREIFILNPSTFEIVHEGINSDE